MKQLRAIGFAIFLVSLAVPSFAIGTFGVTSVPVPSFQSLANATGAQLLAADFNADGWTDVALTGGSQWSFVPVAFSSGDGSFSLTAADSPFAGYAGTAGARALVGDFNGDHKADVALIGPTQWSYVPMAFSKGDGTFNVTRFDSPLTGWSNNNYFPQPLVADFNGDHKADIALLGPGTWSWIPVALSLGDGRFTLTTWPNDLATWAALPNAQPLLGDFNADGKTDIAMLGPAHWGSLPVGFSRGDGTFNTINKQITCCFADWAALLNVKILVGDFNHDGRDDVALTGNSQWGSLPVAFSNGDGTFVVTNYPIQDFAGYAANPAAKILAGDFNGDGFADLAVTGPSGWGSVPVALSRGDGSFVVANQAILDFGVWSAIGTPILGDFNGDQKKDVALKGAADWSFIPVAFSLSPNVTP